MFINIYQFLNNFDLFFYSSYMRNNTSIVESFGKYFAISFVLPKIFHIPIQYVHQIIQIQLSGFKVFII